SSPSFSHGFPHRGKTVMHYRKPRVFDLSRRGDGERVFVEGVQATRLPQLAQDQPTVTATPERAIYIDAVRTRDQRLDRLFQQHRAMLQLVSHRRCHVSLAPRQKVKFFSASGMPCAIAAASFAAEVAASHNSR